MKTAHPMREVRIILWTLLIAATVASIAANVAHALIRHGLSPAAIGPVLFAMTPPVALLGLFHLMSAWARAEQKNWLIFWFYLGAIIALSAAAFRLSFATIRDLATQYGYGRFDAALFPLIVDGLIAVCTVGLVAATRTKAPLDAVVDTPAVTPPVPATTTTTAAEVHHRRPYELPIQYPSRATTTVVAPPAARVAVPDRAPATTITTAPVAVPEPAAVEVADLVVGAPSTTEELPVNCADEVVVDGNHQVPATSTTPDESLTTDPATTSSPATADAPERATTAPSEPVVVAPSLRLVDSAVAGDEPVVVAPVEPVSTEHAELVAGLVAAGRLQPDKEAGALAAMPLVTADPRPSQRSVAEAAGIDRSIVKKLFDAVDAADANQTA